jgi:hypothetical protein
MLAIASIFEEKRIKVSEEVASSTALQNGT